MFCITELRLVRGGLARQGDLPWGSGCSAVQGPALDLIAPDPAEVEQKLDVDVGGNWYLGPCTERQAGAG